MPRYVFFFISSWYLHFDGINHIKVKPLSSADFSAPIIHVGKKNRAKAIRRGQKGWFRYLCPCLIVLYVPIPHLTASQTQPVGSWYGDGFVPSSVRSVCTSHDDVIKWKHFPRLTICAGNSPVTGEFPAERPVTRSFDIFFIRAWMNGWLNNREAGDLRSHRAHYDVTVMLRPSVRSHAFYEPTVRLVWIFDYSEVNCAPSHLNSGSIEFLITVWDYYSDGKWAISHLNSHPFRVFE